MNIVDKPTFEQMMEDIDSKLSEEGIEVSKREVRAILEFTKTLEIGILILSGKIIPINEDDYSIGTIPWHISNWYKNRYSNKMRFDYRLANMVVQIRGTPYRATLPLVYGYASIDPFNYIEDLTPASRSKLSKEETNEIATFYIETLIAINKYYDSNLPGIGAALTKLEIAVNIIMHPKSTMGDTKFGSLSFVEILLKSILEKNNLKYRKTHKIKCLLDLTPPNIANFVSKKDLDKIQCPGGVRYEGLNVSENKTVVSQSEAIEAHHASLRVLSQIMSLMFPD